MGRVYVRVRKGQGFTFEEREEFRDAFARAAAQLPAMFRAYWHCWKEAETIPPQFLVYADSGSLVLRLTRLDKGGYRADGITGRGTVIYAVAADTITQAIRATGLLKEEGHCKTGSL